MERRASGATGRGETKAQTLYAVSYLPLLG